MNLNTITSPRETVYLILSAIVSVLIYLVAALSIIGIGIALIVFAFVLFTNAIMLGSVRGNGVRLSERQFPDVYARAAELSAKMGLRNVPDIFIVQSEGALNAFATRFFGRNMIVLYSEVFELAREKGEKELDFIIAHELAHIRRRHILKNLLIMPARFVPFLAQAYSRSCEYSCDREAAYITGDGAAAKRALTLLGAGKGVYREVDETAWLEQIHSESNGAVWLSEILSSHPNLPKRVQAVGHFMQVEGTPHYRQNNGRIALWATGLTAIAAAAYVGVIVSFAGGGLVYGNLMPAIAESEEFYEEPAFPPLSDAVYEADDDQLRSLIEDGADLEETDGEETTALHFAAYDGNASAAAILLEAGADPNASDIHGTALTTAVDFGHYDIALLLYEAGADPYAVSAEGISALESLKAMTPEEFEQKLKILQ
ncbi:heat-shock protein HtpX [Bhargavaea cecembensis]|uniref:Heat-shock protein HtpX n=1 Tax=Bhargavaea cecembensis TaxID=394098 RepID=A0A163F357_9BACL|nr:M48 family metallopeptidase [Bhargavaea cecembensis]KZE37841.1 heat-shock protein HtpX [Bhargavaea cecembensis]